MSMPMIIAPQVVKTAETYYALSFLASPLSDIISSTISIHLATVKTGLIMEAKLYS